MTWKTSLPRWWLQSQRILKFLSTRPRLRPRWTGGRCPTLNFELPWCPALDWELLVHIFLLQHSNWPQRWPEREEDVLLWTLNFPNVLLCIGNHLNHMNFDVKRIRNIPKDHLCYNKMFKDSHERGKDVLLWTSFMSCFVLGIATSCLSLPVTKGDWMLIGSATRHMDFDVKRIRKHSNWPQCISGLSSSTMLS